VILTRESCIPSRDFSRLRFSITTSGLSIPVCQGARKFELPLPSLSTNLTLPKRNPLSSVFASASRNALPAHTFGRLKIQRR
jgi:hypothetical protein